MRLRDKLIIVVCVVLMVVLLTVAGMRLDYINSQRAEMKLISNEPLQNAPPSLAFATVAMGAFRGLVVDILWMRADKLKEQGQFFDAKQLAEWITVLQPRFAQVWAFQAWNMAYNISVAIPAEQPDQRWQWVKNGYELLRDKGIPLNPKSISLYRELGRIFQHKIGSNSDDAHKYYKLQLALSMEQMLGPADNAWFESLAKAPADWSQIAADANIAMFIAALKAADKNFEDDSRFVGNYLSLRQNPGRFTPAAFKVIDRFRNTAVLRDFDVFAKAWQLRNVWKLDPVLMLELNRMYGPTDFNDPNYHYPLDWRHADVHAIYWAVRGLRVAGKKDVIKTGRGEYPIDEINTDRIVASSLQNLFRYGKIFIYDTNENPASPQGAEQVAATGPTKDIFLRADFRMFDPYNKAIVEIIRKYARSDDSSDDSHMIQHRNMLTNALTMFYQAGHRQKAQKIYDYVRQLYPRPEFNEPAVETYIIQQIRKDLKTITITKAMDTIMPMLREAYFRYALRDDDASYALEKMAEDVYNVYTKQYGDEARLNLPEFKVMKFGAFIDFFNDQGYPLAMRQNLLARIKIEQPKLAEQFSQIGEQLDRELQQQQQQQPNSQ
ncbi:MAG: hypothetical protein ABSB25_02060 [Sedimentisphaerales bacterium]|jgi:hypothetical protein